MRSLAIPASISEALRRYESAIVDWVEAGHRPGHPSIPLWAENVEKARGDVQAAIVDALLAAIQGGRAE